MDIEKTIRRTWRYWYEDGLAEMAQGIILLGVAAVFLAETQLPAGPLRGSLSAIGVPVIVVAGALVARRVLVAVKERIVYPRTGYVAYHRARGRRALRGAIMGAATGALVALLFTLSPASHAWIPALEGLLFGGVFLYMGSRLDLLRLSVLGVLSALAGALISLAGLGDTPGSAAFFGTVGVALLMSGALTLSAYLRHNRLLAEEEDHGR